MPRPKSKKVKVNSTELNDLIPEKGLDENFSSTYSKPDKNTKILPLISSPPLLEIRLSQRDFTKDLTLDRLNSFMQKWGYKVYIIAQEVSVKRIIHFHLLVHTSDEIEIFRKRFHEEYPQAKGTKYNHIAVVQDPDSYFKYITKDLKIVDDQIDLATIRFNGVTVSLIEHYHSLSYKKGKDSFAIELEQIREKFILSKKYIDDAMTEFIYDFIQLKCKFNQTIRPSYIKEYSRTLLYKKEPKLCAQFAAQLAVEILKDPEKQLQKYQ